MKRVEEKVINNIKEHNLIADGDKVLIALSGGADSVFLLHFLCKFKKKYKIEISALHINHLIRGKEAAADEEFCRHLCKTYNVNYLSLKKNVRLYASKNKVSLEEAGRIIRYKLLEQAAVKLKYNKIATAHNSNDNTETVLLNLIKGTGLKGLAGIPPSRGKIIRPVLSLKKSEIMEYLRQAGIPFRTDASNMSDDFERNFIRNRIIPPVRERLNPSLEDAVLNSSFILRSHYAFITRKVEEFLNSGGVDEAETISFDIGKLLLTDQALTGEIIKTIVERNFSIQLTFKDVLALTKLVHSSKGRKLGLPGGLTASREKERLIIYPETEKFTAVTLEAGENVRLNGKSLYISEVKKSSFTSGKPEEEYIAADDLDKTFVVREWMPGDKFIPLGMKGSKKVSDFLNERKIDTYLKNRNLLLTNRGRIVWVIGLRLDERFKLTGNTKKTLKLCLK